MSFFSSTIITNKGGMLAYALPTLFISFTLTFAGTYLTFDRTRSFTSHNDPENPVDLNMRSDIDWEQTPGIDKKKASSWEKVQFAHRIPRPYPQFSNLIQPSKKKSLWRFEGGVGGLLTGYMLGVYVPTILTFYITQHTSRTLKNAPFLIITVLSVVFFSLIAARFHRFAVLLGSVGGSFSITTFAGFAVNFSTLGRLCLWAVTTVLLAIAPILYFLSSDKFSTSFHWSMRLAQSSLGSMGVVYSIALLANVPGWSDALGLLWATSHPDNGATLALSITGWLLLVLGVGCDWTLYRTIGPSPDQNWDNYLAHYLDNLPNRAGHFERLPSLWTRFSSIFHKDKVLSTSIDESGDLARARMKSRRRVVPKDNRAVRFTLAPSSSEDSEHLSDLTLQVSESEKPKNKEGDWGIDKYEAEADITSHFLPVNETDTNWKPAFLLKDHGLKTNEQ